MNVSAVSPLTIQFSLPRTAARRTMQFLERRGVLLVIAVLSVVSVASFLQYYQNGLGLAYNDARSHLDIGRRVVEGLKPGIAQLGSVWLPLTHFLMTLTIWNDFMWHSGLAGALQSMAAFVGTGVLVYRFLKALDVGLLGRFVGVALFAANLNILYLQSTAMTELMLIATMTAGAYHLLRWFQKQELVHLIGAGFWIMLSTLVRYDGWFLLACSALLLFLYGWKRWGYQRAEGTTILFAALGGFGIALWLLWNLLIFKDPLFFATGPYSAYAQQKQLETAGVLATKGHWLFSLKVYFYALAYNSGVLPVLLGLAGALALWMDTRLRPAVRLATVVLVAPLFFNVLALFLGHSVLFVQGLSGDTWFNVRYGVMLMPSIAIFVGYLLQRAATLRAPLIGFLLFVTFFAFVNRDAVTIDDARVGSSQKNVTEVSGWLAEHASGKKGFILISVASHDAIIFSSGLPMKKFIHEGTGKYWEHATTSPERWARWMVMRTYSENDATYRLTKNTPGFQNYDRVASYPFADVYELKSEFLHELQTEPVLGKQK
ncbi:MAG: hypothetical protein Q8R32_02125 [bacterium]|nr:hypothetical protein [bacterium]